MFDIRFKIYTGTTGAEALAKFEEAHGPLGRAGYEYWRMRGEYSMLPPEGLDAWEARDAASKQAERTDFDAEVEQYLSKLPPEARERKLHAWGWREAPK